MSEILEGFISFCKLILALAGVAFAVLWGYALHSTNFCRHDDDIGMYGFFYYMAFLGIVGGGGYLADRAGLIPESWDQPMSERAKIKCNLCMMGVLLFWVVFMSYYAVLGLCRDFSFIAALPCLICFLHGLLFWDIAKHDLWHDTQRSIQRLRVKEGGDDEPPTP